MLPILALETRCGLTLCELEGACETLAGGPVLCGIAFPTSGFMRRGSRRDAGPKPSDTDSQSQCQHNDLPCEYMPSKRKFANLPKRPASASATATQVISTPSNDQMSQDAVTESSTPPSLDNVTMPSPVYQYVRCLAGINVVLRPADINS